MKKAILILLTFNTMLPVIAEEKDERALLEIFWRPTEISVSPSEEIWITTYEGDMYYTESIYSDWHYNEEIYENSRGEYKRGRPNFRRVSFFNSDTAILTGNIESNIYNKFDRDGYYLTENGGVDWELMSFGVEHYGSTTEVDSNGNAWLFYKQKIYYSNDFGKTWDIKNLTLQLTQSSLVNLFMVNELEGYLISDNYEVLYTYDNWDTYKFLPSPINQRDISINRRSRITHHQYRVYKWKDFLVVNLRNDIFYTDLDSIYWKEFSEQVIDIGLDDKNQQLYAISDSLDILLYNTPNDCNRIKNSRMDYTPIDIVVTNGSAFILDETLKIYKVNENEFYSTYLYTSDEDIPDPKVISSFDNLTWGAIDNHLYISENSGCDWYRVDILNSFVSGIDLVSDSSAILWNGFGHNYSYDLTNKELKPYKYEKPIEDFLKFEIKSLTILSGSRRGDKENYENINFKLGNRGNLYTESHKIGDRKGSDYKSIIKLNDLKNLIEEINENPYYIPDIYELGLDEEMKQEIEKELDDIIESEIWSYKDTNITESFDLFIEDYYLNTLFNLDTVSKSIIKDCFDSYINGWAHYPSYFYFYVVNSNNDTLFFNQSTYTSNPWLLPWDVEYKGLHFFSYNLSLSRLIKSSIPEKFRGREYFDEKYFLSDLLHYLYYETKQPSLGDWFDEIEILLKNGF